MPPTNYARAALVDVAAELNKVLKLEEIGPDGVVLGVGIDVKLGASQLRSLIAEAATMIRPGDKLTAETRKVVDDLLREVDPEAKTEEKVEAEAKTTPAAAAAKPAAADATKPSTAAKVGKFTPVERDTPYGSILACALTGGQTVAEVALAVASTEKDVLASLKAGRRNIGIGFAVGEDGVLSIALPDGVDAETVWAKAKPAKAVKAVKEKAAKTNGANGTRKRAAKDTGKEPKSASEFKPIRAGTIRERIIARMNGKMTTAEIASALSLDPGNTHAHIYCLWRDCGLGFSYDAEQRVSVLLPKGVAPKELIKVAA